MGNYVAYIDESGDPNFSENASRTFFVAAVVIPRKELPAISTAIADIKKTHGVGQLKSNKVNDFDRRFRICECLTALNLRLVTIHVNKSSLYGEWFKRKQTFYKYIQSLLNHEIYRIYNSPDVMIDKYGSPEYQDSLTRYLKKKLQGELFESVVQVDSAKDNEFIQVSDFIAGSIRKALEGDFAKEGKELLDLFRPNWRVRLEIPDDGHHVRPLPSELSDASLVVCLEEAWRYLEKSEVRGNNPKIRTLEYLYYSSLDGRNDWVNTHEILDWLRSFELHLSEEQFRTEVTAALRDEGLVIVSSRKGLKIPLTPDDFHEYIQFSVNLALPVLKRLKKAITFVSENTSLSKIDTVLSDEVKNILNNVNA